MSLAARLASERRDHPSSQASVHRRGDALRYVTAGTATCRSDRPAQRRKAAADAATKCATARIFDRLILPALRRADVPRHSFTAGARIERIIRPCMAAGVEKEAIEAGQFSS